MEKEGTKGWKKNESEHIKKSKRGLIVKKGVKVRGDLVDKGKVCENESELWDMGFFSFLTDLELWSKIIYINLMFNFYSGIKIKYNIRL